MRQNEDLNEGIFAVEQIVGILQQAEGRVPVRQLKQRAEENQRLKRRVAELTLDKTMLQDVLAKKFCSFRDAV